MVTAILKDLAASNQDNFYRSLSEHEEGSELETEKNFVVDTYQT